MEMIISEGSSFYVWSEEAISVDLATLNTAVGWVGGESYGDNPPPHTHTLNASQLICLLCHDFYPVLEVSHTWKGSHNHPLTLRNQNQPAWTQVKRHSTSKFCKDFCGIKQVPPVLLHGIGGGKWDKEGPWAFSREESCNPSEKAGSRTNPFLRQNRHG